MTNIEKVKKVRDITMAPMNKINKALEETGDDVDKAIELLIKQQETSVADIANRKADNAIVYSYVHANKIGAMIVIASQTDFVAKNEVFLQLAKDICMHIVSSPNEPQFIDYDKDDSTTKIMIHNWTQEWKTELKNKPENIIQKILEGKINKKLDEVCLLRQKFVKDDTITIKELINKVSATVGEKIEVKKFVRVSA